MNAFTSRHDGSSLCFANARNGTTIPDLIDHDVAGSMASMTFAFKPLISCLATSLRMIGSRLVIMCFESLASSTARQGVEGSRIVRVSARNGLFRYMRLPRHLRAQGTLDEDLDTVRCVDRDLICQRHRTSVTEAFES